MSNVRHRHIVRDDERRFAHKVRLPHCRLWRMDHVDWPFLDAVTGGFTTALTRFRRASI
ncbi:MAG: hypothetical protein PS018_06580 [bacterium]|nr:hypothetical protein [bacterium]